jgi:hypothetical protein
MSSSSVSCATLCYGRGGYNKSGSNNEDGVRNMGRGGFKKGPDDDEPEDGRGGYN